MRNQYDLVRQQQKQKTFDCSEWSKRLRWRHRRLNRKEKNGSSGRDEREKVDFRNESRYMETISTDFWTFCLVFFFSQWNWNQLEQQSERERRNQYLFVEHSPGNGFFVVPGVGRRMRRHFSNSWVVSNLEVLSARHTDEDWTVRAGWSSY